MNTRVQPSMFAFVDPEMPVFDPPRCEVREINHSTLEMVCLNHHYAGRLPGACTMALGMYVDDIMAGAIAYGPPAVPNVQRLCGDEYKNDVWELKRLFVFDWCGRNSESWFVGQSFRWLRQLHPQVKVLVSYSDEGAGHLGWIYQATNFVYTGFSIESGQVGFLINGVEHHNRGLVSLLGTRSPKAVMERFPNAVPIRPTGKHRYVYFLGSKTQRKRMRAKMHWPILPYPKSMREKDSSEPSGFQPEEAGAAPSLPLHTTSSTEGD